MSEPPVSAPSSPEQQAKGTPEEEGFVVVGPSSFSLHSGGFSYRDLSFELCLKNGGDIGTVAEVRLLVPPSVSDSSIDRDGPEWVLVLKEDEDGNNSFVDNNKTQIRIPLPLDPAAHPPLNALCRRFGWLEHNISPRAHINY